MMKQIHAHDRSSDSCDAEPRRTCSCLHGGGHGGGGGFHGGGGGFGGGGFHGGGFGGGGFRGGGFGGGYGGYRGGYGGYRGGYAAPAFNRTPSFSMPHTIRRCPERAWQYGNRFNSAGI